MLTLVLLFWISYVLVFVGVWAIMTIIVITVVIGNIDFVLPTYFIIISAISIIYIIVRINECITTITKTQISLIIIIIIVIIVIAVKLFDNFTNRCRLK